MAKNITKIVLENNKLVIEYNDNKKKTIENEGQELQKYRQIIKDLPNQQLSLSDLKNDDSANISTNNGNNLYKGLAIGTGVVILAGMVVYFVRKRFKKKNNE